MKKIIYAVILCGIIFSYGMTAFAGSIPEDLLGDDKALVFFGEVVSYKSGESIAVLPTQKVKGDVLVGTELLYVDAISMGEFSISKGKTYLFGYYDENNPLYVFNTSSTDTKTLKILNKSGGGMEERMQEYLNAGRFEEEEIIRIEKQGSNATDMSNNIEPLTAEPETNNKYWVLWTIAFAVALGAITFVVNHIRKIKK